MSERERESAPVRVGGLRIRALERVVVHRGTQDGDAWLFGGVTPVGILVEDDAGERRIDLPP